MNTPAPLCVGSIAVELDTNPFADLAARQFRLVEAMCETFFRQLKLINTVMIELPLLWVSTPAMPEHVPDTAEVCETAAIQFVPAPPTIELMPAATPAPVEPLLSAARTVEPIRASEILPPNRKQRKSTASRSRAGA